MARTAAMTNVHGAVADVPTDLASLLDVGGKPHAADVVSAPSLADALGTSSDAARGRTPAFEGRWFLKRSEHIRRWIRTWIALDASGTMLEMKNDALDVKPRAVVRVRDVRSVALSSVNFHGGKEHDGACVYVAISMRPNATTPGATPESGLYLVAETPSAAAEWVVDARRVAGLETTASPAVLAPPGSGKFGRHVAKEAMRAVASTRGRGEEEPAPATPSPEPRGAVANRRGPRAPSSSVSSASSVETPGAASDASFSFAGSDSGSPTATVAAAATPTPTPTPTSATSSPVLFARDAAPSAAAKSGGGTILRRILNPRARKEHALASSLCAVTERLRRAEAASRRELRETSAMATEALRAKDERCVALTRALELETHARAESSALLDALQRRLEESATALEKREAQLASTTAAAATLRAKYEKTKTRAEDAERRADEAEAREREALDRAEAMTREVARVRSRADETQRALMEEGALLQASTHRAAAVERTLRASLEEASSRRDALAREAFEATRATKELREEKEALVDELCSERNRGEALMVAAEALRAKRGWRGLFRRGGDGGGGGGEKTRGGRRAGAARASACRPPRVALDEAILPEISADASVGRAAADVARALGGDSVARGGETPDEAAIRRRLFYGIANAGEFSPNDVIDRLDSPGTAGCRQM